MKVFHPDRAGDGGRLDPTVVEVRQGPRYDATEPRGAGELVLEDVALVAKDDFVARLRVGEDRDEVRHGAAGHEQGCFLAHRGCSALFQQVHRRVVAENVIAHRRRRHQRAHSVGRTRLRGGGRSRDSYALSFPDGLVVVGAADRAQDLFAFELHQFFHHPPALLVVSSLPRAETRSTRRCQYTGSQHDGHGSRPLEGGQPFRHGQFRRIRLIERKRSSMDSARGTTLTIGPTSRVVRKSTSSRRSIR